LRRPKHSKNEIVAPKEEEEEDMSICLPLVVMVVVTCWRCWPNVIITTVNISDCVKTDDIRDCGNSSYVHNNDDNSHISGGVVGHRNTKQTLEPTWKLDVTCPPNHRAF
jgi:hypothetical protein